METQPPTVKHLENTPAAQTASNTLLIIGLVVGIFGAIALVSYFFFAKTYSNKMAERQQDSLLYDNPNEKNILGAQITDLPQLQIGGNQALNPQQQQMTQQQMMQAQMMQQQQQQQQAMQRQAQTAPPATKEKAIQDNKPPSPTATPTPENTYINNDLGFKVDNQGWTKQAQTKDGEITIDSYKNKDASLILNITTTTKKYDSEQAYIDSHPRGRVAESSADFSIGSKNGKKTAPYTVSANGTTYRSIGVYVAPKDGTGMIGLELDSTSLDVNDHSADDTLKKITDSFTFIDKKTP